MTRQEKRGMADIRAMKRHERTSAILAGKARKNRQKEEVEANGLVIGIGPGVCLVADGGEPRLCHTEMSVAPGDRVAIRHEKVAAIAERRTTLSRTDPANPHRERVIAANLDVLVIVASVADPPFRPGLVDRYLVAAARGGIQPVLCMTKIDLADAASAADLYRAAGTPVVCCSVADGRGLDELSGLLAGNLAVFAGHSGVGKSSLLNALAGEECARVGSVSAGTGRGRHTTTGSRLWELRNGARIIDTAGIREFGLGAVSASEVRAAFPEFEEFVCRFRDCRHLGEPGCAVVGTARYAAYLRLMGEV
ncbi:MAG TPA: ribosome small subunit-dependent GTPase A [Bryobacteraceae bacterium]|nr:ribosome small subunit-dependent GTPase A [Bryobacteraceae bacterium]